MGMGTMGMIVTEQASRYHWLGSPGEGLPKRCFGGGQGVGNGRGGRKLISEPS